ncbi:MAG: NAD-dependent epimerase/dehydratase family protein [Spirochaetota bacterium]
MRLLLTGAAGIVGTLVRPILLERGHELVSADLKRIDALDGEVAVQADVRDRSRVDGLVADAEAVIHLASAVGAEYTFEEVSGPNVQGQWNVLLACARHRRRLVYASSHHAVGFLPREGAPYGTDAAFRPDSPYGLSKAFGELMAQYFFDRYGVESLGIRIGSLAERAMDERRVHTWCSPRDLVDLFEIGLTRAGLGHRVVYGQSDNPAPFFDNATAESIGFAASERSTDHLADPGLLDQAPDPNDSASRYVGGFFATADAEGLEGADGGDGDLQRPDR